MSQEPLIFAVIGCGALARGMHIPNIAKSPKAVLRACCDLSDEALKNAAMCMAL
jgi:predicted dehydrogenase